MTKKLKTTKHSISFLVPKHLIKSDFEDVDFLQMSHLSEGNIPGSFLISSHKKSIYNVICLCETGSPENFQEALELLPKILISKSSSLFLIDIAIFRGDDDFSNSFELSCKVSRFLGETGMRVNISFYP